MCSACEHALHMSKMIQIRNGPDAVHARLKQQAASSGMTLSDFLLEEVRLLSQLPTQKERFERLAAQPPADVTMQEIVEMIREDRERVELISP